MQVTALGRWPERQHREVVAGAVGVRGQRVPERSDDVVRGEPGCGFQGGGQAFRAEGLPPAARVQDAVAVEDDRVARLETLTLDTVWVPDELVLSITK